MDISNELQQQLITMRPQTSLPPSSRHGSKPTVGNFDCREDLFNFVSLMTKQGMVQIDIAKQAGIALGTVNTILTYQNKTDSPSQRFKKLWKTTNPFGYKVENYDEL